MNNLAFRLANKLFEHYYPLYYPLYATWKAFTDRREQALLRRLIKPGMIIADVGANIGVYTRFFSALADRSGGVHAFEPSPVNFKRLKENTIHLRNVMLTHAAVGENSGSIYLYVSRELNVDHRTYDSGEGRDKIYVPLVSLDDYFSASQRIDLIKIDVQGYELGVLKGAIRLLEVNRDITVLMEFWPYGLTRAGVIPKDIIEFMTSLGFVLKSTNAANGACSDSSGLDPNNPREYCNLIARRYYP